MANFFRILVEIFYSNLVEFSYQCCYYGHISWDFLKTTVAKRSSLEVIYKINFINNIKKKTNSHNK